MTTWLVAHPQIEAIRGSSPGTSKKFSYPESHGIKQTLWLQNCFIYTCLVNQKSLHTRFFRSIYRSVFRYRFTKNGSTSPKSLRGFRETCPWSGTLCCVLGQGSLLSLCLSPPRCINGYCELLGKPKKLRGMTCDGLASRPGGVEILLAVSCYRNRDKLRQLWAGVAPRLHFHSVTPNNNNYC